jgi:hypothetical protein
MDAIEIRAKLRELQERIEHMRELLARAEAARDSLLRQLQGMGEAVGSVDSGEVRGTPRNSSNIPKPTGGFRQFTI